jgi:hypothetical protein
MMTRSDPLEEESKLAYSCTGRRKESRIMESMNFLIFFFFENFQRENISTSNKTAA